MNKIKEKIAARFKGMTFKSYLKETFNFFNTNLKKPFLVLGIISILIIVMGVSYGIAAIQSGDYAESTVAHISFGESYFTNIQVILIVIFAGIVPYMYIPVISSLAIGYTELTTLAYLIVKNGYLKASLVYILPMLLNITIIVMSATLGMYICKTVTARYRLDNMKYMNSTNFKLQLYELTKKDKKKKELEKKKNKKIKELEDKSKKIDYFGLVNITIILFILQLIASLFRVIII